MNGKERIIHVLERKEPDQVPILEWSIDKKICNEILEKSSFLEVVDYLDLDGLAIRPDYKKEKIEENLYLDEWGCIRRQSDQFIDIVVENPLKSLKDFKKFKFPDPQENFRFKSIEKAIEKFGNSKAIVLNIRDIFSDLRDIFGYENTLMSLVTDLKSIEKILMLIIDYNIELAKIAKNRFNLDILVTTDDIADNKGLIFNPKLFFNFFGPKLKKLIKNFKSLGYYCIKHCDGNIMEIMDYLASSGIDCIDPIDPSGNMDIKLIKEIYGKRICIKGNINCTTTLVKGSLEEVDESVKYCIKNVAAGGGYILSSSNSIHSGVKTENFLRMIKICREYGNYPIDLNGK